MMISANSPREKFVMSPTTQRTCSGPLRRARSITLEFEDESGHAQRWSDLEPAESELFQHELDHLDGVLAVDRAVDAGSIVTRAEFARESERFAALVDLPPRV